MKIQIMIFQVVTLSRYVAGYKITLTWKRDFAYKYTRGDELSKHIIYFCNISTHRKFFRWLPKGCKLRIMNVYVVLTGWDVRSKFINRGFLLLMIKKLSDCGWRSWNIFLKFMSLSWTKLVCKGASHKFMFLRMKTPYIRNSSNWRLVNRECVWTLRGFISLCPFLHWISHVMALAYTTGCPQPTLLPRSF